MFNVTFVCLGNICRSPMAEAVFLRLIQERGVAQFFRVGSCGTSDCEEDNSVYLPVQKVLKERGYDFKHRARKITLSDIKNADCLLVMDGLNYADLVRTAGFNYSEKIYRLGHFLPEKIDIDDPWYTRDFERAYNEIYAACNSFLDWFIEGHKGAFGYDSGH